MQRENRSSIKVINVMKDGRMLESLEGIEAPDILYDILLRDYRARGVELVPIDEGGEIIEKAT